MQQNGIQGRLENSSHYAWGMPQTAFFGAPLVIFHAGLGPGDSLLHEGLKAPKHLSELRRIGRQLQKQLQKKSTDAESLGYAGIEQLEAFPLFNSGLGAKLQKDGVARLSASVMRGDDQRFASVSNLESIVHASHLTKALMKESDRNLSGIFATAYAMEKGIPFSTPETPERIQEWLRKSSGLSGTVGCIALDEKGRTFAATSTGGRGFERPGRISDSGTPTGNYATPFGAVSCTGVGEEILEAGLAVSVLTRVEDGSDLNEAVWKSFARHPLKRFGLIALDQKGHAVIHATEGTLFYGLVTKDRLEVGLCSQDWIKVISR